MRELPLPDPDEPDHRSPLRYLLWVARRLLPSLATGMGYGTVWMVTQALMPATIGQAIDAGLTAADAGGLALWSAALFGLGVIQAAAGVMRHRFAVFNWLAGAYLTIQVVTRQATRLGATLPKRLATGEVVSVGIADISHVGNALDVSARASGAVVSIVLVGTILLATSPPLGLIVLIGVPLMAAAVAPLLRPLHRAQQHQRDLVGELTTRSGDIVAGLRVLRGIGGEQVFADRYRAESQAVRRAGVQVARADALLEGAQVLLPGLLVALVTWLGARFAVNGTITVGQLVAFYGYAFFLIQPMSTLTEAADKSTKALVSSSRIVRILAMRPDLPDDGTATAPAGRTWWTSPQASWSARVGCSPWPPPRPRTRRPSPTGWAGSSRARCRGARYASAICRCEPYEAGSSSRSTVTGCSRDGSGTSSTRQVPLPPTIFVPPCTRRAPRILSTTRA